MDATFFSSFDMISQSLNLSLFATYKLIKRPLPSKRHGEMYYFFSSELDKTLMMRLITEEKNVLPFVFFFFFFFFIYIYDLSKFEFEYQFYEQVGYLDIRNFCYYARNRHLPSKRHREIS